MIRVNYWAVVAAAVAVFVISSAWYSAFTAQLATLHPAYAAGAKMPVWKVLIEVVRCLVVAGVIAGMSARLGITTWPSAFLLAVVVWIGFPVVLWTGAIILENVPISSQPSTREIGS